MVDPNEPVNREVLDKALQAVLEGVDQLFANFRREFDDFKQEVDARFNKVDARFDKVEAGQQEIKNLILDLKATTPSREEFDELQARVDRHHPLAG